MMRRLALGLLVGLLMLAGAVSAHDHGVHIRVAHLSATSPSVDVYVGDMLAVRGLSFLSTSGYIAIDGNVADVSVVPAGGRLADAVYSEELVFAGTATGFFTVVAIGDLADFTFDLLVLPEDAQSFGTASAGDLVVRGAFARPTAQAKSHDHDMGGHGHGMAQATPEPTMPMGGHGHSHGMGGMSRVSGVFMTIENRGDTADTLIAAASPVSNKVEIHETTITDGVAQMGELEGGLEIPANSVVELRPGGYHVMLLDLTEDLVEGKTVTVTLIFASGTEITLEVPIMMP